MLTLCSQDDKERLACVGDRKGTNVSRISWISVIAIGLDKQQWSIVKILAALCVFSASTSQDIDYKVPVLL